MWFGVIVGWLPGYGRGKRASAVTVLDKQTWVEETAEQTGGPSTLGRCPACGEAARCVDEAREVA